MEKEYRWNKTLFSVILSWTADRQEAKKPVDCRNYRRDPSLPTLCRKLRMTIFFMQYKNLEDNIKKCSSCQLRGTCNQVVPGEGSPKAEILLIGEAPGAEEDKQGLPFVGAA